MQTQNTDIYAENEISRLCIKFSGNQSDVQWSENPNLRHKTWRHATLSHLIQYGEVVLV